jgi:hypothetical protein
MDSIHVFMVFRPGLLNTVKAAESLLYLLREIILNSLVVTLIKYNVLFFKMLLAYKLSYYDTKIL